MESKYGGWRNLDEARRNHKESIWWWDLCFVCGLEEEGGWLNEGLKWKIGCGLQVKFWEDRWREEGLSFDGKVPETLLYISTATPHYSADGR